MRVAMSVARSLGSREDEQRVGGEEVLGLGQVDAGVQLVRQAAGEDDHREERCAAADRAGVAGPELVAALVGGRRAAEAGEAVVVAAERAPRPRDGAVGVGAEDLDDGVGNRRSRPVEDGAADHDRAGAVREDDLVLLRIVEAEREEGSDRLPGAGQVGLLGNRWSSCRAHQWSPSSGSNQVASGPSTTMSQRYPIENSGIVRSWS